MRSIFSLLLPLSALALFLPSTHAEETPAAQELRELRQAMQQQSKQIEVLSGQVARLIRTLEGQKNTDSPAPQPSVEIPTAAVPPAEPMPEAPKAEAVPRAEPVVGGPKHTVVKGETLTSIAKRYNIPVADLKKANKIEDERKLQIGQVLSVPAAKTPETPEKKENP